MAKNFLIRYSKHGNTHRRIELIEEMNQITDLKMAVNETFSSIISEIQLSNLNFSVQITPFSAYITLKKSVIKDQNGNHAFPSPPILFLLQQAQKTISELQEENDLLKIRSDAAENNYENLANENAALVEAIAKFNNNIAASDASYNTLHAKLKAAEAEIIKIRSVKNSCEARLKDSKTSHQHEINSLILSSSLWRRVVNVLRKKSMI